MSRADSTFKVIGRPTKAQKMREWANAKAQQEVNAAAEAEYQSTEQTAAETPTEKKNKLRRWECESGTCGNVIWCTTFEQRALCGRCYLLDGSIRRMVFAPIGPARPAQKPIPPPRPAESCEHPKGALFLNRALFEPGTIHEVCGECNATLRTYQEGGPF